jgi:preprotein translocase subunit SecB
MKIDTQAKLSFTGVEIVKVSFNAFSSPQEDMDVKINCIPRVFYPEDDKFGFKIIMDLEVKDERYFQINLSAIGNFQITQELTDDLKKKFVNSNAPAIMFPYIRSFISTLTANLGNVIGTVTIPTQFFTGSLEEFEN